MEPVKTPQEQPEEPLKEVTITEEPKRDWLKIVLFSFLGLLILSGAVYGGYWCAQTVIRKSQIIKETPTPSPVEQPTPTPTIEEQTKDWKTYRNEKYGFEMRCAPGVDFEFGETHPQAEPKEFPRFYLERNKDAPGMRLRGYANSEGKELSRFVEDLYKIELQEAREKGIPGPQKLENPRYVDINGIRAYQGTEFAFDSIDLVTYIPGDLFIIQARLTDSTDICLKGAAGACADWYTEEDKNLLIRTLQTFKFTTEAGEGSEAIPSGEKAIGYINAVYEEGVKRYLDIDYIQFLVGSDAKRAVVEDGKCVAGEEDRCLPNGYYIRNQNPKIRTFEILKDVEIRMQTYSHTPSGDFSADERISFDTFKSFFNGTPLEGHLSLLKTVPYWIELESGVVTKITEQYIP